jgi:carboxymethylenebutenolidase
MCDDIIHQGLVEDPRLSRRAFGLATLAAAGGVATASTAQPTAEERDVTVKTPDGMADAVLFYPKGERRWSAVLIWPDIMGLRPVFRDMGRRLAEQGYVVLVPNPFYRSRRAPVVDGPVDFSNPEQRKMLFGFRSAMTDAGIDKDAVAYLAFLDAQPQTDRARKAGVQGYCMGGALAFRTAAAVPDRIAAVASLHGGNGLVTAEPSSPHRLIPSTRARFLVAQAQNDDAQQPQVKDTLRTAFHDAGRPAVVEVFPANHGWCVKGSQVYDEASAERAWSEMSGLYRSTLA